MEKGMTSEQSTIYVGIDVSKDKLAVAIAGGERRDDVLSLGTFENTPASVSKLLKKLPVGGTSRSATRQGLRDTVSIDRFGLLDTSAVWSHRRSSQFVPGIGSRRTDWTPCVWHACYAQEN